MSSQLSSCRWGEGGFWTEWYETEPPSSLPRPCWSIITLAHRRWNEEEDEEDEDEEEEEKEEEEEEEATFGFLQRPSSLSDDV
ncbi:hypothetical protein FRB91_001377 [Serendipita sp. 411]|nr:hypothetical protein FRB91_001377 [Serendipita sp. 411]